VVFLVPAVFFRTLAVYLAVLLVMRLMGKREVGQLSIFDLVVAIMIAEIAVFPIQDLNMPLYMGLIPMFILVGAEMFISYLCLYSRLLRRLVDGCPSVLISNGKIIEAELRRQRYNINDLMGQLREKGVFNIADVQYAVLETSGELSVLLKNTKRPIIPEDLNITPSSEDIPVPVILDGEVLIQNLEYLSVDRSWLEGELKSHGLKAEDILYASLDCRGKLYLSPKKPLSKQQQKQRRG